MSRGSPRPGLYYCRECISQFTVTVGTVCEQSHIPLHKWVLAFHLMGASKKGISALQLQRMLGLGSYKSAWFMAHRIREAMDDKGAGGPIGGEGKTVEVDETHYGQHLYRHKKVRIGTKGKSKVMALVERGGKVRARKVDKIDSATAKAFLLEHAKPGGRLMTDETGIYTSIGSPLAGLFISHQRVMHTADEYVRGDVYTNTVENFFSVFKRGMRGVYQHCGNQHLQRYVTEFEFRFNHRTALGVNDDQRARAVLKGIEGKRLTYRRIDGRQG